MLGLAQIHIFRMLIVTLVFPDNKELASFILNIKKIFALC